jgi:adenine-specific DNA-methyltransferase
MDARFINPDDDPRGPWASGDLVANEERTGGYYDVVGTTGRVFNVPKGKHWVYSEENLRRMIAENRIWFGKNGDAFPRLKRYLSEVQQGRKADTLWLSSEVGHNQESKREIIKLFDGVAYFDTPKPVRLISRCLSLVVKDADIILDFFSGSSTTAHAVLQLNAEDNGNRKFIMVQIPEPCDEKSEAYKAGFKNIAEIGKERIRRAGKKIKEENQITANKLDTGFRVFKVDTSNMRDVYYTPDELKQGNLELFKDHIKPDRRPEDLLFQVFIDWGLELTLPIAKETIDGKTVFFVDTNALIACFDPGITEELVRKLAKHKPLRVVFRDDAFGSDSVKINVEQIFRLLSPGTEVKAI